MVIFAEKRVFQPVLWDQKYQHWFSFHTVWSDTSFEAWFLFDTCRPEALNVMCEVITFFE
jgi:hypothetical protein